MKRLLIATLVAAFVISTPCSMLAEEKTAEKPAEKQEESHSFLHKLAWYIPNRILDAFDMVRLRVRVGPGVAADVRVTKMASVFAGTYATVYAGLPGPRNRRMPKLPVGLESKNGVEISVIDATVSGGIEPDYGPVECGFGAQILLVGFDFGIEPFDILDFITGFFFIDLRRDDI